MTTGQSRKSGQRDRSSLIVPRQRDNETSSKSCQGTDRDGILTFCQGTVRDGILTVCPVPSWTRRKKKIPFRKFCFDNFRLFLTIFFDNVIVILSRDFCSGPCPGTRICFVLGQREYGTRIFFVPGQQNIPSRFVLGHPGTVPCHWKL